MSLIACRECGRSASSSAEACPQCGAPIAGRKPVKVNQVGPLMGLFVVASMIIITFRFCGSG